jgi:hypothetical protein
MNPRDVRRLAPCLHFHDFLFFVLANLAHPLDIFICQLLETIFGPVHFVFRDEFFSLERAQIFEHVPANIAHRNPRIFDPPAD